LSKSLVWSEKQKGGLASIDTTFTEDFSSKKEVAKQIEKLKEEFYELQEKLVAVKDKAILFVFQGMDCSGKDGVIKNIFSGLNPQGVSSYSFKSPSEEEKRHDFLWRAHMKVPALGYIATFNRSYYEDVLITRVHGMISEKEARQRFKHINHFESLLEDSQVHVVKIFLHISKDFQLEKLRSRIEDPTKNWKFDPSDLAERKFWDKYWIYYEEVFEKCSKVSPWHIIPSDNRWYRDYAVLKIVVESMRKLKLRDPEPDPDLAKLLDEFKIQE